jgi:CubicO group peptidase (beta-lactamase class C family)
MALWLEAQINDGVVGGRRVLPEGLVASTYGSRVTQETTFGPYQRTGYGLGWQVGRYGDDVLIHHFGNFAGSRAHVSFMPERRIGVAVMINEDAFVGDLADVVANYAYDWFAGLPDIEAVYDAKLAELAETRDRRRTGLARSLEARAARPRSLSLPNAAYVGDYVSPSYGTLRVREAGERLELAIGVQHAVAENFTDPESLRVELTPLVGEVVAFSLDAGGRVAALAYGGETYVRSGLIGR